jgi:hypothetical protein
MQAEVARATYKCALRFWRGRYLKAAPVFDAPQARQICQTPRRLDAIRAASATRVGQTLADWRPRSGAEPRAGAERRAWRAGLTAGEAVLFPPACSPDAPARRGAVIEFTGGFDRAVFVDPDFGRAPADRRQGQALLAVGSPRRRRRGPPVTILHAPVFSPAGGERLRGSASRARKSFETQAALRR